jgi:xanthosine utilization system XapX-like protein
MKKIIVTILITLIFVIISGAYAVGIIYAMTQDGAPAFLLPIAVIIFIGIVGVLGYNMYERINEIKRGDENDISKY